MKHTHKLAVLLANWWQDQLLAGKQDLSLRFALTYTEEGTHGNANQLLSASTLAGPIATPLRPKQHGQVFW